MTTLTEYATAHFPNHLTHQSALDRPLTDHTAIAHVVGSASGAALARRAQRAVPGAEIQSVMIRATDPSAVGNPLDRPHAVELHHRRMAPAAFAGALVVGAAIGTVAGLTTDSPARGIVVGVLTAALAAFVAAMASGGVRDGQGTTWDEATSPDRTVAVVAAFAATEADAIRAARAMDELDPYEVRIVSSDGAWHVPAA
jgi:hypothetical protein